MGKILGWLVGTGSERNRELDGGAPMVGRRRAQGGGGGAHMRGKPAYSFIGGTQGFYCDAKGARRGGVRPARGHARLTGVRRGRGPAWAPRCLVCVRPWGARRQGGPGRRDGGGATWRGVRRDVAQDVPTSLVRLLISPKT
jgi:hypothetical protein